MSNEQAPLKSHHASWFWCCVLPLLVAICGCAQATYPAARLPAELQASVESGQERLSLGALAGAWSKSDVIYPGDMLSVVVVAGVEDEPPRPWMTRVHDTGLVDVPLIGAVQVAGMRFPQAEQAIRSEGVRRGMYVNPTVSIELASRQTNSITVTGAVEEEGVFEVPKVNSNVLAAIMQARGLSQDAGLEVEIRSPASSIAGAAPNGVAQASYTPTAANVQRINLAQVAAGQQPNLQLEDGATVNVLKRPLNTFQVIGLVRKPNQFEMEPDHEYRLLEAIALAGDRTMQIADKVHILRRPQGSEEPIVISASISRAKSDGSANIVLAPGDVVSVEETPVTATVGAVRDFIRFGFSAGIPGL